MYVCAEDNAVGLFGDEQSSHGAQTAAFHNIVRSAVIIIRLFPLNIGLYACMQLIVNHRQLKRHDSYVYWPNYYSARSYRLQTNIGFTLRRVSAEFTCSAITPPKVNRLG